MAVQGINNHGNYRVQNHPKTVAAGEEKNTSAGAAGTQNKDTITLSCTTDSLKSQGYSDVKKLSSEQIQTIKEKQLASFNQMLVRMLGKQVDINRIANGEDSSKLLDLSSYNVTPEEAKQSISEDGYWGVNAVATRIMDMAVALAGGDESKIAVLRKAVEDGFAEAIHLMGGNPPSITGETYDEISRRFDYWEANGTLEGYSRTSAKAASTASSKVESSLSSNAQTLLDGLRKTYGNVDFMVAKDEDEAEALMANSNKEFSVVFTVDELEKMAKDSDYKNKMLTLMQSAFRMSKNINEQFGVASDSDSEKDSKKGLISKLGVYYNEDGASYYAMLKDGKIIQSSSQSSLIEKLMEALKVDPDTEKASKKAEEAKAAQTAKEKKAAQKADS